MGLRWGTPCGQTPVKTVPPPPPPPPFLWRRSVTEIVIQTDAMVQMNCQQSNVKRQLFKFNRS